MTVGPTVTKSKMDILSARPHMSGLPNGKKWMEHGRNGVEVKEVQVDGTQVRVNFLVAHRSPPSFIMAYR
jgi:hypothetical protein